MVSSATSPSEPCSCIFLGWHKDALTLITERLYKLAHATPTMRALDLSALVLVVPTREASRQIRLELAARAAEDDAVLFPPIFLTPSVLLTRNGDNPAPPAIVRTAWMYALKSIEKRDIHPAFPHAAVDDPAWLLSTAVEMENLSTELSGAGLSMSDAQASLPNDERWEVLSRIESNATTFLHEAQYQTPLEVKRLSAATPNLDVPCQRIIALCSPDLPGLAVQSLQNLASALPVEVWIHAPASHSHAFTSWGTPVPNIWSAEQEFIHLTENQIRMHPDAEEAARDALREWACSLELHHEAPLLCPVDVDCIQPLVREAKEHGLYLHNLEGIPCRNLEFCETIRAWLAWYESDLWEDAHRFWTLPAPSAALRNATNCPTESLLLASDNFQASHIPSLLTGMEIFLTHDAKALPLQSALAWMTHWRQRWKTETWLVVISDFLLELFGPRPVSENRPADAALILSWEKWTADAKALAQTPAHNDLLPSAVDAARFLLSLFDSERIDTSDDDAHADLPGWLEVAWRKGRHIILCGAHEGHLPNGLSPNTWLTETARATLGLPTDSSRLARDHFLLRSAVESRPGGVTTLLWRHDARGEPIRPSRLLFACDQDTLIQRIETLLQAETTTPFTRTRHGGWKLHPLLPDSPILPTQLTPHHIQSYLICPFRFYLKYIRKLDTFTPYPLELSSTDFGTIIHTALDSWSGLGATLLTADKLYDCALEALHHIFHKKFLNRNTLNISIQLHWMKQRLRAAADREADSRASGWLPGGGETTLLGTGPLVLHGIPLGGKLDRWDHNGTGHRVVDYKTGKAVKPSSILFKNKAPANCPPWLSVTIENKTQFWQNLQLPLYALLLDQQKQTNTQEISWFFLPESAENAGLSTFKITTDIIQSALACATGVAASIRQGIFWPPTDNLTFDNFEPWLPDRFDGDTFDREIKNLYASRT